MKEEHLQNWTDVRSIIACGFAIYFFTFGKFFEIHLNGAGAQFLKISIFLRKKIDKVVSFHDELMYRQQSRYLFLLTSFTNIYFCVEYSKPSNHTKLKQKLNVPQLGLL